MGMSLGLRLDLSSARSGSWSPSSLGASLYDMWDADDVSKMTLSGSSVSSWRSRKNSYDAGQAVAGSRPVYGPTSFNGRSGVTFDGVDDELSYVGSPAFPSGLDPCEMWLLFDQQSLAGDVSTRYPAAYGGDAFASTRGFRRTVISGVNRIGAVTGSSGTVANNTAVDASGRIVARAVFDGTNKRLDINGQAGAAVAMETTTAPTRVTLGAVSNLPVGGYALAVVALFAVTAPLSVNDAAKMLAYLKGRGGIA